MGWKNTIRNIKEDLPANYGESLSVKWNSQVGVKSLTSRSFYNYVDRLTKMEMVDPVIVDFILEFRKCELKKRMEQRNKFKKKIKEELCKK